MRLRKDPARPSPTGLKPPGFDFLKPSVAPDVGQTPSSSLASRARAVVHFFSTHQWLAWAVLAAATFLAYWPCLNGDFVWDDDAWTLKLEGLFRTPFGLKEIWTNLTALQQYYPLSATSFWLDYHFWGYRTLPYHVENVLLHLFGVWLFWRLLKRLEVPGAALAASFAALHPLMVESVGWITERKNVLSLVLYLGALLCYGRFARFWKDEPQTTAGAPPGPRLSRTDYVLALLLFLGADLAKATAFSFPAVLLVIGWWKRGCLRWRRDVLPTLPFWASSVGLGLVTSWLERTHVGAQGPDWALSFAERCLIAGRALCFYAGKLLWPANLCFIYPRWQLDSHSFGQWLWPVGIGLALSGLWLVRRRIGRGPLAAVLLFIGTLFPLLGFFNGYFMRYSFVCDHWAYLSSFALLALAAASISLLARRVDAPGLASVVAIVALPMLWIQTRSHSVIFADSETLYRATLTLNPNADLAHNNLALLLARAGNFDEAIPHLERAAALRPGSAHAHNNLANAFRLTGRTREAVEQYELALKLEPDNANTLNNLALLLATSSDASVRNGPRAIELAQRAQRLTLSRNPVVLATLAAAFAEAGRFADALKVQHQAVEMVSGQPDSGIARALQSQLRLYERGLPFRESNGPDSR